MADRNEQRRIEVPTDLLDDPVESARFVVSLPDVVLLVDGDPVAELGWEDSTVAERREALVHYLADLSAASGAMVDVVFDGRIGGAESLPSSRAVRIRLSSPPTEPVKVIDELIDAYPEQSPIAMVTNNEFPDAAVDRGVAFLTNDQLVDLLVAGSRSKGGNNTTGLAAALRSLRSRAGRSFARTDRSGS